MAYVAVITAHMKIDQYIYCIHFLVNKWYTSELVTLSSNHTYELVEKIKSKIAWPLSQRLRFHRSLMIVYVLDGLIAQQVHGILLE